MNSPAGLVAVTLVLAACGPTRTPAHSSPRASASSSADTTVPVPRSNSDGGRALFRITERDLAAAERWDGGTGPAVSDADAGPGVAISAEAGVQSAEISWLLLHLGDEPETAIPTDTPAVRALAARGPEGVRVVLPLLDGGDPERAPYARRVVERVLMRSCRNRGALTGRRMAHWLETGVEPEDEELRDAGVSWWDDPPERAFSLEIIARLRAWADAGAPCSRTDSPAGADSGTLTDASVRRASPTDE